MDVYINNMKRLDFNNLQSRLVCEADIKRKITGRLLETLSDSLFQEQAKLDSLRDQIYLTESKIKKLTDEAFKLRKDLESSYQETLSLIVKDLGVNPPWNGQVEYIKGVPTGILVSDTQEKNDSNNS